MSDQLVYEVKRHWQHLRSRTYELLEALQDTDLSKRLPFPESETLGYQLWCMLAMSNVLIDGLAGKHFADHESLFNEAKKNVTVKDLRLEMEQSDEKVLATFDNSDLLEAGETSMTPLWIYLYLTEHEAHHHGQIINFLYAHHLPIPESWSEQWALTKD